MATLAVILARAGSKGLPCKNVADLAGRPLIAHTIDHALAANSLDHVVVSTDGHDIATVACRAGVEVIERPAQLAHDTATVDAAARHAAQVCEADTQSTFDAVVILYGNVPLRPPTLIDAAVHKLRDTGADSVQSVCPVGKHHPYWMKRVGDDRDSASRGTPDDALLMYEDNAVYRRQDLPPVYMLDGGVIAVTRDSLFTTAEGEPHAFLGGDRRAVVTQPGEVVDVDNELDLMLARVILVKGQHGVVDATSDVA